LPVFPSRASSDGGLHPVFFSPAVGQHGYSSGTGKWRSVRQFPPPLSSPGTTKRPFLRLPLCACRRGIHRFVSDTGVVVENSLVGKHLMPEKPSLKNPVHFLTGEGEDGWPCSSGRTVAPTWPVSQAVAPGSRSCSYTGCCRPVTTYRPYHMHLSIWARNSEPTPFSASATESRRPCCRWCA